jgi:hypothetical protein
MADSLAECAGHMMQPLHGTSMGMEEHLRRAQYSTITSTVVTSPQQLPVHSLTSITHELERLYTPLPCRP